MSHAKILLRALPNVEFVHGFPGIPPGPDRPQATIRGAVEVRLGNQPVKAKWVKVELRKIESIPGPGNRGEEFVDLVGQSPITVWEAKDEHETLSSKDFPFNIRVPETIPPSVALERGAGIKYEVVATLCTREKKGLFRREASTPTSHSVPVVIDKHELHSTWPIYAQPESRHVVSNGLTLAVDRSHTCYAPGDRLSIFVTFKSDNLSPVVLRGFEFSLRETIIYRTGPQSHGKKNGPLVQASVLGEQKLPVSMTLYGGTQHKAELACVIPGNHTTSSVNAGRHIDIGYSLNIKAIVDLANPVVMDLPVTISNWPRHVSAEMIRRIGTAPNLSLKPVPSQRPFTALVHSLDSRSKYGPPHPPPSGGLPSIPNGDSTHSSLPRGALVSTPPGSPNAGQSASSMNPYSFQQITYGTAASQAQPQLNVTPDAGVASASSDASAASNSGDPDEFGYSRQPNNNATTLPLRHGENHDFGVADAKRRASSANQRATNSQSTYGLDTNSSNRISQYSQDSDSSGNVGTRPASATGRRARAMSRTLKIMNVPEEESPIKTEASPKQFESTTLPLQSTIQDTSPPGPSSSASPWPTAGDEKQQLYEAAKAKTEQIHREASQAASQIPVTRPSNGHVSPLRQASPASIDQTPRGERPSAGLSTSQTSWPTAGDEKQRLFENAQAKARQIQQRLVSTPPSNPVVPPAAAIPASGSTVRPSHNRAASSNSSQDSQSTRGLAAYAVPSMSAGAALYSHAMASINRPSSNMYTPATPSSNPRRNLSTGSSNTAPSTRAPPRRQVISTDEDKSALRYYEARSAVQRQQQQAGNNILEAAPQEGPIPYDELFGARSDAPPSGSSASGASPPLSEKEAMRRAFEARDAAAAAAAPPSPPPAAVSPTVAVHKLPSERTMTPPVGPSSGLSEKEIMRRAFEARDVAIIRSGQAPPLGSVSPQPTLPPPPGPVQYSPPVAAAIPLQPASPAMLPVQYSPPARSPSLLGGPSSSNGHPAPSAPLSEKEQMRRAFEARDRVIAAQQAPPPPDYDSPSPPLPAQGPPPSVWSGSNEFNGRPLSAAEEKAQLKARYAAADASSAGAGPAPQSSPLLEGSTTPQHETFESPSSPTRTQSHRSHKSHKSDSSETFLRRDPSISAGKKRASQMMAPAPPTPPPPPPLPPRPPAEYIEETKQEDRRNTLETTLALPPSDFSTSFDLGFDTFSIEPSSSEHRSD